MSDIDPDTLLEWLQTDNPDVTLLALEQLCTILLLSDNIDRCFESYPPRSFLPALCKIFLDEMATDQVLEATARAITYYLDVSQECTRRIVACDGTIRAICSRLLVIEVDNKTSKDLAEQCIKSLELLCARESSAVFEAGGLTCILPFILEHGSVIHKDTLHSAMSVVTRLCGKMEPNCDQQSLDFCVETLSKLLVHEDAFVADGALRCFVSLSDRFIRKGTDPTVLAKYGLIEELLKKLNESINLNTNVYSVMPVSNNNDTLNGKTAQQLLTAPTLMGNLSTDLNKSLSASSSSSSNSAISITMLTSLLSTLCRSSDAIFKEIVKPNSTLLESVEKVCSCGLDERCVLDIIRFLELLLTLIYEGRQALTAKTGNSASIKQEFSKNSTNANQVSETDEKVRWDKLHRHLIELIRIKDTESFIDSLESSITSFTSIDVINFMDDVGQTLLNWAAAFGTPEMVEYLASARGADVNKGLRSSSLHYASCFGRAQIVKILLRYGADPELRDEEGKTPLDKARERDEDSHRDCVQILQQSSNQLLKDEELLSLVNSSVDISEQFSKSQETKLDFDNLPNKNNNYIDSVNKSNENQYLIISEHADNFRNQDQDNLTEIKLIYSKRLLPMLSKLYLTSCMIQSVNKSCLNLLRKLVNYCSKDQLHKNLTENSSISTMLVEVIGKILQEHEDEELSFDETDSSENDANISNNDDTISNYEAIYIALTMSQDLFNKCSSFILDEFTRFGVSNLIVQLTQTKLNINQTKCGKNMQLVDIKENCVYNWVTGNWAIIYSSDFLYIWQPFCVIELSHKSNGWFRFMLNNKLYIMFTDGKQEMISNTTNKEKSKSCEQFMNRFINAKDVALNTNAYTVLPLISQDPTLTPATSSSQSKQVENWIFQIESAECDNNNHQLSIKNNHSTTCLNLRTTLKGFDFVSNKNEIVQLIGYFHQGDQFDLPTFSAAAQNSNKTENLTNPASATFNKLSALHHYLALTTSKTAKLKLKQLKLSIFKLATRLNDDFLKPQVDSQNNRPRPIVIALISIIQQIKELYIKHEEDFSNSTEALSKLEQSFTDLKHLLVKNESSTSQNSLSSYEISVSGFVQILLTILSHSKCELKLNQRIQLFVRVFITEDYQQSIFLIRKLISLLESTEKLPLYLYDTGTYNLQAFSKRFKLTLKKGNPLKEEESPDNLLNFTGRVLKVEPLANISHLEKYITKMVVKQWHDYPRKDLHFLKKINESLGNNDIVEFRYENDFDENGLLYWIGTNGKTKPEWMNPIAASNLIRLNISESSRQQISSGKLEDMIGRSAVACHTNGEDKRVWIVIDLGVYIIPTHYTLRYSKGFTKTAPRNWALLASRNGGSNNEDWDLLSIHTNDDSLKDFGSSHTWCIRDTCSLIKAELNDDDKENSSKGWRFFRIQQTGRNQSGSSNYTLSLSGFEIYGRIKSVVLDESELRLIHISTSITRILDSSGSDVRRSSGNSSRNKKTQSSIQANTIKLDINNTESVHSILQKQTGQLGARVMRGQDWKWNDQDCASINDRDDNENITSRNSLGNEGTVIGLDAPEPGWLEVVWDNGVFNFYRMGHDFKWDLTLAASHDLVKLNTYFALAMQTLAISRAKVASSAAGTMCSSSHNNYKIEITTSIVKKNRASYSKSKIVKEISAKKDSENIDDACVPGLEVFQPPVSSAHKDEECTESPPVVISFTSLDNTYDGKDNESSEISNSNTNLFQYGKNSKLFNDRRAKSISTPILSKANQGLISNINSSEGDNIMANEKISNMVLINSNKIENISEETNLASKEPTRDEQNNPKSEIPSIENFDSSCLSLNEYDNSNQTISAINANEEDLESLGPVNTSSILFLFGNDENHNENESTRAAPYHALNSLSQANSSLLLEQHRLQNRNHGTQKPAGNNKFLQFHRHYSLQNTHDKSQSTNNLLSAFITEDSINDLSAVSEPNVLQKDDDANIRVSNNPSNIMYSVISNTSSSSYFPPLEPTAEECSETPDTQYCASYEIKETSTLIKSNDSDNNKDSFQGDGNVKNKEELGFTHQTSEDHSNCENIDYFELSPEVYRNLLASKESTSSEELENLLNKFSVFAQKKTKFNSFLKTIKSQISQTVTPSDKNVLQPKHCNVINNKAQDFDLTPSTSISKSIIRKTKFKSTKQKQTNRYSSQSSNLMNNLPANLIGDSNADSYDLSCELLKELLTKLDTTPSSEEFLNSNEFNENFEIYQQYLDEEDETEANDETSKATYISHNNDNRNPKEKKENNNESLDHESLSPIIHSLSAILKRSKNLTPNQCKIVSELENKLENDEEGIENSIELLTNRFADEANSFFMKQSHRSGFENEPEIDDNFQENFIDDDEQDGCDADADLRDDNDFDDYLGFEKTSNNNSNNKSVSNSSYSSIENNLKRIRDLKRHHQQNGGSATNQGSGWIKNKIGNLNSRKMAKTTLKSNPIPCHQAQNFYLGNFKNQPHGITSSNIGPVAVCNSFATNPITVTTPVAQNNLAFSTVSNSNQQHLDEYVLKCQFSALIPAFDPRPGKHNINQIQDISVPLVTPVIDSANNQLATNTASPCENSAKSKLPRVELYLRIQDADASSSSLSYLPLSNTYEEIKLLNKNSTIFQYIQSLMVNSLSKKKLSVENMKSIWDLNYSLIYRETTEDDNADSKSLVNKLETSSFNLNSIYTRNDFDMNHLKNNKCHVNQILQLLSIFKNLIERFSPIDGTSNIEIDSNKEFISNKINNKLVQQLHDPLVLASRSMPDWCKSFLANYNFLFPFETRQLYFTTTAFGVSRSIVWLQNKRDALLATLRGHNQQQRGGVVRSMNNDDHMIGEFRIGRLKHERIKIPREPRDNLLRSAINALKFHANRKAILEIEFIEEEGTGLGPTLEFFSLIATELQRKNYAMWYSDNVESETSNDFIHQKCGLFPAHYPPEGNDLQNVLELFHFMGIFMAKSLQDQRLVDIPFSQPFLKMLCNLDHNNYSSPFPKDNKNSLENNNRIDIDGILTFDDLQLIDPHRGMLLKQFKKIVDDRKKNPILDGSEILVEINGAKVSLQDLGLAFEYNPPSKLYGYDSYRLINDGENTVVTEENLEQYLELMSKFLLKDGIQRQLQSFKDGFDSVFSIDSLKCFQPQELQVLISGEQAPNWTYEEIINYTEPKLGYTKESPGFQLFINVMCGMNAIERKTFVQFLTGCSSLPPGGLANLHPHLTVVKKDGNDSSYPSVNTCVHYLKLPEYSTEEILKQQLTIACQEKGFYLN